MGTQGGSRPEYLSEMLEDYINVLDRDNGGGDRETRDFLEKAIRLATSSLEGFSDSLGKKILDLLRPDPETWRWAVDDFFARRQIEELPGIVRRFLELQEALVGRIPSKPVSINLREATRCFIHGFFQASIGLSRTALEAGLDEYLSGGPDSPLKSNLADKIKWAEQTKLLSSKKASLAHSVRITARDVLHGSKIADKGKAFEVLFYAREFLKELYKN